MHLTKKVFFKVSGYEISGVMNAYLDSVDKFMKNDQKDKQKQNILNVFYDLLKRRNLSHLNHPSFLFH